MKKIYLDAKTARNIKLEKVLDDIGHTPSKTKNTELWYLSPFRNEKTPSFKLNTQINKWFDFGEQVGGNTVDFIIYKYGFSVNEALQFLAKHSPFSFEPPTEIKREAIIEVLDVKDILHLGLHSYFETRRIPAKIYKQYCKQVHYRYNNRSYFAIGFPNQSNGYELRNKFFKGCINSKDITLFTNDSSDNLLLFEGFFDFLSYMTLNQNYYNGSQDFLILNSLSNINKIEKRLVNYKSVKLYLDNDEAGNRATEKILNSPHTSNVLITDARSEYAQFKDLNEYLIEITK